MRKEVDYVMRSFYTGNDSHYWLCEDLLINLGASAEECRNERLH